MQELKMQNGLLLQLVKGLQNQINSKNRENHILFQQYEQLASDNSAMRVQIDELKSKKREHNLDNQMNSPRHQQNAQLKLRITSLEEQIRGLTIQLDQKGGAIIFLQSQLHEAKCKLGSYEHSQNQDSKTDAIVRIPDQSRSVEDLQIQNQLSIKIISLENAIQEKQVLLDSLSRQNLELKQKIVSFESEQLRDKQNIESLAAEIQEQKLILASKEQSLTDLGQFLSSLTIKSQESAEKQADLQNDLKQALKRMISMEQDKQKLKSEIIELKQQNQQKQSEQTKMNEVTSAKEIEVKQIHVKLSTKEDQLLRANQIITEKDRTLTECFERIKQLEVKIQQKQNKNQQQNLQTDSYTLQQIDLKSQTFAALTETPDDKYQIQNRLQQRITQLQEIIQTYEKVSYENKRISQLQEKLEKQEKLYEQQYEKDLRELNVKQMLLHDLRESQKESIAKVRQLQEIRAAKDVVIGEFTELIAQQNLIMISIEQEKKRLVIQESKKYVNIISDLQTNVQMLQSSLLLRDRQISALNAKNSEHQANIQEMQAKIAVLKLKCSQANANSIPPQKVKQLQEILAREGSLIVDLTQKVQNLEAREVKMQKQLVAVEQKYKSREDEVEKEQKNVARVNTEQIQKLNQNIIQLDRIIDNKSETMAQLTQYMNEQALRITDLEAQVQNKPSVPAVNEHQKIAQLEVLLHLKEQCVTELREYLQQNAVRNIELQKKILQLQRQKKRMQQQEPKEVTKIQQIQVVGSAVRVDYLAQIQNLIRQRKLDLQFLNLECQKQQQNQQQNRQMILRGTTKIDNMRLDKKNLEFEIEGMRDNLKDLFRQKQEMQIVLKQMSSQIDSLQNKKSETVEVHAVDKEQEINALTELLQKLINQVQDKKDMIYILQEKDSELKNSSQSETQQNKVNMSLYEKKIVQWEIQVQKLRAKHKQLSQRLQTVKKSKYIKEKAEKIEEEKQLQLESKLSKDSNEDQLNELSQTQQQSPYQQIDQKQQERVQQQQERNQQFQERVDQQQKDLNTAELLSQILIYSQARKNSNMLQKLVKTLTERYFAEFEQYQFQTKKLRAEVDQYAAQQQIYEEKINALNEQIQQLNEQIIQKNELIESLHDLNGEKEKSFNDKIEQLRSSFQVNTDEFFLNFSGKQGKEFVAAPISEQMPEQQIQALKKENAHLIQSVKELKEELQIVIVENQTKAAQIKTLKQGYKLPTNMEKEFVDLFRDSNSNFNMEGIEQNKTIEKLKAEKDALKSKCKTLQLKVKELQKERQRQQQTIESIQKQFSQIKNQEMKRSEQSSPKNKVLSQLYAKKQTQKMQSHSQRSEEKEQALAQKIMEKNEIIAQLEETVLKLQKGYNHQIMQLRRNNAELNGQIINLTKKLYILDPNSIDVTDFVKETCRQAVSETQFYKSRYNLKYTSHYSQVQQPHNSSYLTEHSRSKRYQPFFNQKELTLGEKILGRRCRGDPLNYTINNEYRLSPSAWQMPGTRPL